MSRKIITCTGYGGTGSSAITDLLKEFDNGLSMGDAEFWLLQDYNGISDLEHFLIDGNHRSMVSIAIKKFNSYIKENKKFYIKFFGQEFQAITDEYIFSLVDANFKKALSMHEVENKILKYAIFNLSPKLQYVFKKLLGKNTFEFSPFIPMVYKTYSIPDRQRFYVNTKRYMKLLFDRIDLDRKYDFLAFDQLVPATNIPRYFNYVDNMKVVVVDRDPRDLYLLNETQWNRGAFICDTSNLDEFIVWYKTMRLHRKMEDCHSDVLYIMLEDLIYDYDNSLDKIYKFLDLSKKNHINKQTCFKPSVSINNTRLWVKYDQYKDKIKKIEDSLFEYCYE